MTAYDRTTYVARRGQIADLADTLRDAAGEAMHEARDAAGALAQTFAGIAAELANVPT